MLIVSTGVVILALHHPQRVIRQYKLAALIKDLVHGSYQPTIPFRRSARFRDFAFNVNRIIHERRRLDIDLSFQKSQASALHYRCAQTFAKRVDQ